jgi:DNA-binding LytR/AlgR family response regulator
MQSLKGYRLLIVEDDYLLAYDLSRALEEQGAHIIGPVGTVGDALELIAVENQIDCAVLDINLNSERVYPLADILLGQALEVVFTTGYDRAAIPERYAHVPRYEKPLDARKIADAISERLADRHKPVPGPMSTGSDEADPAISAADVVAPRR